MPSLTFETAFFCMTDQGIFFYKLLVHLFFLKPALLPVFVISYSNY